MKLKLPLLFLALCALAPAQTTWTYALQNSAAICSLPGGSSIPTVGCLPQEFWKAGVWVTIHSADTKIFGFHVVVSVILADGSTSTQEQFVKRAVGGNTDGLRERAYVVWKNAV
jgi:hypothetical protein